MQLWPTKHPFSTNAGIHRRFLNSCLCIYGESLHRLEGIVAEVAEVGDWRENADLLGTVGLPFLPTQGGGERKKIEIGVRRSVKSWKNTRRERQTRNRKLPGRKKSKDRRMRESGKRRGEVKKARHHLPIGVGKPSSILVYGSSSSSLPSGLS